MQVVPPRPDVLPDILRSLRLTGGVFLEASFASPWCVLSQVEPSDCAGFLPLPRHIIAYHYVCAGALTVQVDGEPPLNAQSGDIVILPRNDRHRIGSDLHMAPLNVNNIFEPGEGSDPARLVYGCAETADTRFFCGFLGHNLVDDPLLNALPRVLHLRLAGAPTSAWIESSLRFASSHRPDAGEHHDIGMSAALLGKLAELLFVEAVRQYLQDPQAAATGWIAGLRDPWVGRALALMHSERAPRAWTAESLAREVGLSRSAFAERFTTLVGDPPMRYMARWRLRQAARRLAETTESIARIAEESGYESEPAFHRAFKRVHQTTPAAWRKKHGA